MSKKHQNVICYILFFILCVSTTGYTNTIVPFKDLSVYISNHPRSKAKEYTAKTLEATGQSNAYWKDPELRFEASNFPITKPRFGQTGMTGLQVMLSQSFPLSPKLQYAKEASFAQAKGVLFEQKAVEREIILAVWRNLIEQHKQEQSIAVYANTLEWIDLALTVAKTQYTNEGTSQEALLALQMQKSTITSSMQSAKAILQSTYYALQGIVSGSITIPLSSVPFEYLNYIPQSAKETPEEKAMEQTIQSLSLQEKNRELQNIPDIMAGFAYRYRDNYDKTGDYFSVVLAIPIPLWGQRNAQTRAITNTKLVAKEQLRDVIAKKHAKIEEIRSNIVRIESEVQILKNQTIQYAQTTKTIAMQRYRVGNATYKDVLDAEIRLLTYSLTLYNLTAQKQALQAEYLYTMGENMIP